MESPLGLPPIKDEANPFAARCSILASTPVTPARRSDRAQTLERTKGTGKEGESWKRGRFLLRSKNGRGRRKTSSGVLSPSVAAHREKKRKKKNSRNAPSTPAPLSRHPIHTRPSSDKQQALPSAALDGAARKRGGKSEKKRRLACRFLMACCFSLEGKQREKKTRACFLFFSFDDNDPAKKNSISSALHSLRRRSPSLAGSASRISRHQARRRAKRSFPFSGKGGSRSRSSLPLSLLKKKKQPPISHCSPPK